MKKKLLFLMLLGFSLCHGGVEAESRACGSAVDHDMHIILKSYSQTGSIALVDQCEGLAEVQKTYTALKHNNFLRFYPISQYNYRTQTPLPNPGWWKIFHDFSTQAPRNLTEKMLFPYGNEQYAERGEGIYLCKMGDGIWQSGVRQAEGRLVLEIKPITDFSFAKEGCRKYYEGDLAPQERIKVYFEIEKSPQDLQQLPYVKQHGHLQRVFLGCISHIDRSAQLKSIASLSALTHYYNFQTQEEIYRYGGSSQRNLAALVPDVNQQRINILPYLNQEITMKFYLLPNYLPAAGDNFSECANSWLDAYEIVGV